MEIHQLDDQLDHAALRLIAARPEVFMRQGRVDATYRRRGGRTFGPYYRLSYREAGRQCSVYLGRAGRLVDRVGEALARLQRPRKQRRAVDRLQRDVRASLRTEKLRLATLLRPFGLRLKGLEVRGWRYSPLRELLKPFRRSYSPLTKILKSLRRRSLPSFAARRKPSNIPQSPDERLARFLLARDGVLATAD